MTYLQRIHAFASVTKAVAEEAKLLELFSNDEYNKLSVLHSVEKQRRLNLQESLNYALSLLKQIDEEEDFQTK